MFDHVSFGVSDLARSRVFYDAVLKPLGLVRTVNFEGRGHDYGAFAGIKGIEFTLRPKPASHRRAARTSAFARAIAPPFANFTRRR